MMTSQSQDTLDPADWDAFARDAHAMLDDMIDHLKTLRTQPVWRPATEAARQTFAAPLPIRPSGFGNVLDEVRSAIIPHATGNTHPLFMGWVHGAGTPVGMIAEMIGAGLNMNCGGRNHIGLEIENQIVDWIGQIVGYPKNASGLFLTGSSIANFMAVIVAKTQALGRQSRRSGLRSAGADLVAYASCEAHGCISQAMELAGIGSDNLRSIPVDTAWRMDLLALERAIEDDRAAGRLPFLVVATAGTVNTGAIDDLDGVGDIADRHGIWFHVDGAIGALAMLSDALRQKFCGIERSSSIALDFHKWGHVPYDAGFLLVRDRQLHLQAFAQDAAYLQRATRGLAKGNVWPCDLGPDLSRGSRALKTWMTLRVLGTEAIGRSIFHTCALARYLAERLEDIDGIEIKAPVALNVVCFGVKGKRADDLKTLVLDLHEEGLAAPSWTMIDGELAIRCAIVNHRTTRHDIDLFVELLRERIARSVIP